MLHELERQLVVDACQALVQRKLVVGTAGNVSIRIGDQVVISPSGFDYAELTADVVPVVDLEGRMVDGDYQPSSELPLHLSLYNCTDFKAIVHTHAEASTALGLVVDEVPTSHYYSAIFGGPIRVAPYATFGTPALADYVQTAMLQRNAALMSNHGAVIAGANLKQALERTELLEYVCEIQLRAMSTGRPVKLLPIEEIQNVMNLLQHYGQTRN